MSSQTANCLPVCQPSDSTSLNWNSFLIVQKYPTALRWWKWHCYFSVHYCLKLTHTIWLAKFMFITVTNEETPGQPAMTKIWLPGYISYNLFINELAFSCFSFSIFYLIVGNQLRRADSTVHGACNTLGDYVYICCIFNILITCITSSVLLFVPQGEMKL